MCSSESVSKCRWHMVSKVELGIAGRAPSREDVARGLAPPWSGNPGWVPGRARGGSRDLLV